MNLLRRRAVSLCLILLLALPALLTGCGAKYGDFPQKLTLMQQNIKETEPICDKLVEIANWQIDSAEAYWKEYDEAFANGTEGDLAQDDNLEEVQAQADTLKAQLDALSTIESSYTQADKTGVEQLDMTEQAYLTYISDIRRSAEDMQTMFQYYFDVREALKPMSEFEPAASTTGATDYSLIAGQMSQVISQTQKALEQISYPAYMKDSHDMLKLRVGEYQGLSQDLSKAVQLNDPLRMASWTNRVSRLDIMLSQCSRNLDEDFNLQFGQARDRIKGRVSTLRSELNTNIDALVKAIG